MVSIRACLMLYLNPLWFNVINHHNILLVNLNEYEVKIITHRTIVNKVLNVCSPSNHVIMVKVHITKNIYLSAYLNSYLWHFDKLMTAQNIFSFVLIMSSVRNLISQTIIEIWHRFSICTGFIRNNSQSFNNYTIKEVITLASLII